MLPSHTLGRSVAVLAALALSVSVAAPALARPPAKPGSVRNLSVTITKPSAYHVDAAWTASTNTTSYAVKLSDTRAGVTTLLASTRLTDHAWSVTATGAKAGDRLSVTVTPYNGTRHAGNASASAIAPDLTAPTGSFTSSWDNSTGDATVTPTLADDVTPAASITGTIDWADGSPAAPFTGTAPLTHTYALVAARYVPMVTLTDAAANVSAPIAVPAVVILDNVAPTGTFASTPAAAWAKYTKVVLSQSALSDFWSPNDKIVRTVTWGDGTTTNWTFGTTTLSHVYAVAGSYTPSVVLTDEAGNQSAAIPASTVAVKRDAVAPKLTLTLPKTGVKRVHTWSVLHGRLTDVNGSGAKTVRVRAVEKRGTHYYAYKAATHRWVRTGTTLAGAWTRATTVSVSPTASGAWSAHLYRLTRGTLTYRASGVDHVGNVSKTLSHRQAITRL